MGAGTTIAAYLLVRNYGNVAGVQTAFDFGGFVYMFGLWDCQPNQVNGHVPEPPGGVTAGTITTAFDCIAGGGTRVIGRLHMLANYGCLTQVQSSFPFGTHVVDCVGAVTPIYELNWGAICVDYGGIDVCDPVIGTAVEESTWGGIKARFHR